MALAVLSRVVSDLLLAQGFSSLGLATTGTSLDVVQVQGPEESVPPTTTWWWQAVAAPHTATPFDLAHTIGTALLVLGLALLLGGWIERTSSRWRVLVGAPFAILAAAGSMTPTPYTLHVLLLTMQLGPDGEGDGRTSAAAREYRTSSGLLVAVVRSEGMVTDLAILARGPGRATETVPNSSPAVC